MIVGGGAGGVTASDAVAVTPPNDAEMVSAVDVVTVCVVTVNVAVLLPAGTVTLGGTVAAGLLLESVTEAPPDGAAALSVTVALADVPLVTLAGVTVNDATCTALGGAVMNSVLVTQ